MAASSSLQYFALVFVYSVFDSRKCHHSPMLPTAKGQTGEIPVTYPDLGRPPGRGGSFPFPRNLSPSVLGRRGTGKRTITALHLQWWASSLSALQVLALSSSHRPGGWGQFKSGCLWAGHSPSAPAHGLGWLAQTREQQGLTWEQEEERRAGKCFHPGLPLKPPHCTTLPCKAAAAQGSWRNHLLLPRHASF